MDSQRSRAMPQGVSRRTVLRSWGGALLASPLLAACGGTSASVQGGSTTTASTASVVATTAATSRATTTAAVASSATVAPAGAGATLDMWAIGGPTQADVLTGKVFPGLYQQPSGVKDIQVQMLPGWQDLFQKLTAALAGGVAPDFARIKDYWTAEFAVRGVLLPLDTYLAKQQDITGDKYGQARWDSARWKGKVYALPFTTFVEDYFTNNTLFQQLGLKPAQTWDEQTDNAKKLTDPSKGQWGFILYDYGKSQSGTWDFIPKLWQAGGEFTDPERTTLTFNSDPGVTALAYQVDLIWKYKVCVPPDANRTKIVENGKIGQWQNGCWQIASYPKAAPQLQYTVSLMPALKGDNRAMIIGGNNVGGFKETKRPDQAWQALAWLGRAESDLVWNSETGYLPVRVANWAKPPFADDPHWQAVIAQAQRPDTRPIPIFVGYEEVTDAIGAELQNAYFNKKPPKVALADAERIGNELLKKYSQG